MDILQTRLSLMDNVTAPVMKMTSSLDMLIRGFKATEQTMNHLDGGSMDSVKQSIDLSAFAAERMAGIFDVVEKNVKEAADQQQKFNNHMRSGAADELLGKIKKIAGAVGLAFGARQVIDFFRDSVTMTNEQIRAEQQLANVLANQGASQADFLALKQKAAAVSGNTMYTDSAMIGGAAELSTYISDAAALDSMMGTLANYVAGMSGGVELSYNQMVEYATQLGKALDGTYDGLKKKGFELSDAQKKIIENGTDMEKALVIDEVISQSWTGLAEQMAHTPAGMQAAMTNAFNTIRANAGAGLLPSIMNLFEVIRSNMPQIEILIMSAVGPISTVIDCIAGVIGAVFSMQNAFSSFFMDNLQPLLIAGISLLVFFGAQAMVTGITAAGAFMVAHWPLMLIIATITLVILALHKLGFSFEEIFGMIGAVVGGTLATIVNIFIDLWNFLADFANKFARIFDDPLAAIVGVFISAFSFILDLVSTVAGAIDAITGSNLAGAVDGFKDKITGWYDATFGPSEEYVKKIDKIDPANWANAGYNMGAKVGAFLDNPSFNLEMKTPGDFVTGIPGQLDSINGNLDNIAGNTGKQKDFTEEQLKYFRDMAERETINRFTTVPLTVDMTGMQNTINNGMDIDGVVNYLSDGVVTALEEISEGVHV